MVFKQVWFAANAYSMCQHRISLASVACKLVCLGKQRPFRHYTDVMIDGSIRLGVWTSHRSWFLFVCPPHSGLNTHFLLHISMHIDRIQICKSREVRKTCAMHTVHSMSGHRIDIFLCLVMPWRVYLTAFVGPVKTPFVKTVTHSLCPTLRFHGCVGDAK